MNKKIFIEKTRSIIPDIDLTRNLLSKYRTKSLLKRLIPDNEIKKAELNKRNKEAIVLLWERKNQTAARKFNKQIDEILKNNPGIKNNSDWNSFLLDMKFCNYAYGFLPYEYICYDLYLKDKRERNEYISDLERIIYIYKMNDILAISLFNDKCKTYEKFSKYYHRECIGIEKESDLDRYLKYVKKFPRFVKKEVFESIGNSVALIDLTSNESEKTNIFYQMIKKGKHILEEPIFQDSQLSVFNSSSVNTVKCITMKTKHSIEIPFCFFKAGRSGSFVDNGGAGGILVGVDTESGILNTNGVNEVGQRYDFHPDTGIQFNGYQLPEWEALKDMCKDMASCISKVQIIGWDLAYTSDFGWVLVEGNGGTQFVGPQTTSQKGIRKTVDRLMQDMVLFS